MEYNLSDEYFYTDANAYPYQRYEKPKFADKVYINAEKVLYPQSYDHCHHYDTSLTPPPAPEQAPAPKPNPFGRLLSGLSKALNGKLDISSLLQNDAISGMLKNGGLNGLLGGDISKFLSGANGLGDISNVLKLFGSQPKKVRNIKNNTIDNYRKV